MAHVVSIVYSPAGPRDQRPADRYDRVTADAVELAVGHGIVGDRKGGSWTRQINMMSAETLAALRAEGFCTGPGEMGEQVVVSGLAVDALPPGTRLRLGGAVVEVTLPRTGCGRFEAIQGKRAADAAGRLGVLVRVIEAGPVHVGDAVGASE